jgi:hypothetical protein
MIAELQKQIDKIDADIKTANLTHKTVVKALVGAKHELETKMHLHLQGTDIEKVALAREWVFVEHASKHNYEKKWESSYGQGDTEKCLCDAIDAFIYRPEVFDKQYVGCKDYDRWVGQYHGFCEYGMGPRHGSITFRVGKLQHKRGLEMKPAEIEAVLYYLKGKVFMQELEALKKWG